MDGELFFRYEISEPARSDRLCQYFLSSQINSLDTCAMPALRRASRRWRGGEIHPALARILAHRNVCGCCWEWGRRDDTAKFCKSVFAQKLFLMSFGGARISHQRRETLLMAWCRRRPTDRPSLGKWGPFLCEWCRLRLSDVPSKVVSDSQLIRTEPIPDLGARIGLVEHWESD